MSSRIAYPAGPGYLTMAGLTIEFAKDWKIQSQIMKADIATNLHGVVGASEDYVVTKITGTPIATSANLAALIAFLYPWQPDDLGSLIFPASDVPAVLQTADGKSVTYAAAAVTKMPDATFAPNTDIFGDVEITCLRALDADPTAAADVADPADSAFTAPSINPLTRIRSPYTVAWGSTSPFDAIETDKTGVKFKPTLRLDNVEPMLTGLKNMRVAEVGASVSFVPLNLDVDDFYAFVQLAAATAGVGGILGARGQQLTVISTKVGDPTLTIPLAVPDDGTLGLDNKSRVGEVTLTAHRKSTTGVLADLFTLGVRAS